MSWILTCDTEIEMMKWMIAPSKWERLEQRFCINHLSLCDTLPPKFSDLKEQAFIIPCNSKGLEAESWILA